mgnify:CR=1 FL=1
MVSVRKSSILYSIAFAGALAVSTSAQAQIVPGGGGAGGGDTACTQYYLDGAGQCMSNNVCGIIDYRQPAPASFCKALNHVVAETFIDPGTSSDGCDHFQRNMQGQCIYVNSCGFSTEVTPAPEQNCH